MCHGAAIDAFPEAGESTTFQKQVAGYAFGDSAAERKIAILPDIYGCNPFYMGMATRFAQKGAEVLLIDTFHPYGPLPENTRDAAFARRHTVNDNSFLNDFQKFVDENKVTSVIGFCLGGLYIFELARRGLDTGLIGLYGFPQGMENKDPLAIPFNYLPEVTQSFTMLMGKDDAVVGAENMARLDAISVNAPAMSLSMYDGVGHGFLPLLDSKDAHELEIATDALAQIDAIAFA